MLFSCAKEELDWSKLAADFSPARDINITASMPSGFNKAFLPDTSASLSVYWEAGDAIRINDAVLTTGSDNTVLAYFAGSVGAKSVNEVYEHYFAVYPADLCSGPVEVSKESINKCKSTFNLTLPDVQYYSECRMPNNYMVAHVRVPKGSENVALNFKNICSVLKFNLKAKDGELCTRVSKILVTSTSSNKNIAGQCNILFNGADMEVPTVSYADDKTTSAAVVLDCSNGGEGVDITTAKTFYVMIPNNTTALSVKIFGTNGRYMQKSIASRTYSRNNIYTATEENVVFGKEIGFTVDASGTRVAFAPGNLQWSANNGGSTKTTHDVAGGGTAKGDGTWRFAINEIDYVGAGLHSTGAVYMADGTTKCNNELITPDYAGWIDQFGFATSGWQGGGRYCYRPCATDASGLNYGPREDTVYMSLVGDYANCDWGIYNAIYNPATGNTDKPGTWFTLSHDQWYYLLNHHTVGYACTVTGVKGVILCPDDFDDPKTTSTGSPIVSGAEYDAAGWKAMKNAGVVFLPYGGCREGYSSGKVNKMQHIQEGGYYWSTTPRDGVQGLSYHPYFTTSISHTGGYTNEKGRAVRLAKYID